MELQAPDKGRVRYFQRGLLRWWRGGNKRDFPWRGVRDPYLILVAEFMLQQTDAPKVVPAYERFVRRYPNVSDLAEASLSDIKRRLAPLGLDYRAPRLHAAAGAIVSGCGGHVPDDEDDLRELPGVGRYMARSICAIAFRQRKGVLDTNVIRIIQRFFGVRSSRKRPREDPLMWDLVDQLVPPVQMAEPAEWNWALLDFGALVCTSRNPQHVGCPVKGKCCAMRRPNETWQLQVYV